MHSQSHFLRGFAFSRARLYLRSEEELVKVTAQFEIRSSTAAIFFQIQFYWIVNLGGIGLRFAAGIRRGRMLLLQLTLLAVAFCCIQAQGEGCWVRRIAKQHSRKQVS